MITSYHRETHWIVDASQMLPLLKGGTQNVRWSWAPEWNVQRRRRGSRSGSARPARPRGRPRRPTSSRWIVRLQVQRRAQADRRGDSGRREKVQLYAIITGHGGGTHNCAEFCNTQHEFTVNGAVYLKEDPGASTDAGCRDNGVRNR
jgi:hypothetical protein